MRESKITERIPLGRWAEPPDIATNVIACLVVLLVDGGYSIA